MNSRSAQVLVALLAVALIVLMGATIFILLSQPPGPSPSASPTSSASGLPNPSGSVLASPTSSLLASGSPTASPSLLPTDTGLPTITPTPGPTPTPSPSATPQPTLGPPTSPQREITLVDVGIERASDFEGLERIVTFGVDGPSLLSVQLSNLSAGRVRVCISREAFDPERECQRMGNGTMTRPVFDAGHSDWHVLLISPSQTLPYVTVTLRFNSLTSRIDLDNFRYNGTLSPHYNGFVARLTAATAGDVRIQANFEGDSFQHRLIITRTSNGAVEVDQTGGPDSSVDLSYGLESGQTYTVEFASPEDLTGGGTSVALIHATLTWP